MNKLNVTRAVIGFAALTASCFAIDDDGAEGQASTAATNGQLTGIWYSTWYANRGHYVWAVDAPSECQECERRFLVDVDGDGRADAVTLRKKSATVTLALSNGERFVAQPAQAAGAFAAADTALVGDVDGDGRADIVAYDTGAGAWTVALSTGTAFVPTATWTTAAQAPGPNERCFLADVSGDRKMDLVHVDLAAGTWSVAASTGTALSPFVSMLTGFGDPKAIAVLGDVDGDGKADAALFNPMTGAWSVAIAGASRFASPTPWGQHDVSAVFINGLTDILPVPLLADVDGDGKADAVVVNPRMGEWFPARSDGRRFAATDPKRPWAAEHGGGRPNKQKVVASFFAMGDVAKTRRASPVAFVPRDNVNGRGDDSWRVLLQPDQYIKPNMWNTWEAWNLRYVPRTLGAFKTYDSADPKVIDEHLSLIDDAQIDFLILDETNGIDVDWGYIKRGALAVCAGIKSRLDAGRGTPRYAVGVGLMQVTHKPESMEDEADQIWREFVTSAQCGGTRSYFQIDGKPLLVSYAEYKDRRSWEDWNRAQHAAGRSLPSDRFAIRWNQGAIPWTTAPFKDTPPPSDYGRYYGWSTPIGSMPDPETMIVMPGHNSHAGDFTSRDVPGGSLFYEAMAWGHVAKANPSPRVVVINSFNEYAEETAVAPSDTTQVAGTTEKWHDANGVKAPDVFWTLTKQYNLKRKGAPPGP